MAASAGPVLAETPAGIAEALGELTRLWGQALDKIDVLLLTLEKGTLTGAHGACPQDEEVDVQGEEQQSLTRLAMTAWKSAVAEGQARLMRRALSAWILSMPVR
mmetsp:Transcript_57195/g.164272  ORF Transcript_57195/g.164272 Transcript_57195/m.164272 type:complete len:104 (-) Transcript_57195:40-351(-)